MVRLDYEEVFQYLNRRIRKQKLSEMISMSNVLDIGFSHLTKVDSPG
jgi:hypothetical protein